MKLSDLRYILYTNPKTQNTNKYPNTHNRKTFIKHTNNNFTLLLIFDSSLAYNLCTTNILSKTGVCVERNLKKLATLCSDTIICNTSNPYLTSDFFIMSPFNVAITPLSKFPNEDRNFCQMHFRFTNC